MTTNLNPSGTPGAAQAPKFKPFIRQTLSLIHI